MSKSGTLVPSFISAMLVYLLSSVWLNRILRTVRIYMMDTRMPSAAARLSPHLHNHLRFHRRVFAERRDADRGARMLAAAAPQLDVEIRFAVHDLRHFRKSRRRVDEAEH